MYKNHAPLFAFLLLFFCCSPSVLASINSDEVATNIEWLDLIPEEERNIVYERPLADHDGDAPPQLLVGTVRQDLNGKKIKIPGFVIPLEGDDSKVTEFLLVPFLGACIHVPPPPPNQIIYVKYAGGAPTNGLWDLVWITGILRTDGVSSELGETGYLLEGVDIEKYQQ
ncbi:DUF3299 domain-containing protein [Vibrio sp. WJH972]